MIDDEAIACSVSRAFFLFSVAERISAENKKCDEPRGRNRRAKTNRKQKSRGRGKGTRKINNNTMLEGRMRRGRKREVCRSGSLLLSKRVNEICQLEW